MLVHAKVRLAFNLYIYILTLSFACLEYHARARRPTSLQWATENSLASVCKLKCIKLSCQNAHSLEYGYCCGVLLIVNFS